MAKPSIAVLVPYRERFETAFIFDTYVPLRDKYAEAEVLRRLRAEVPQVRSHVEKWEEKWGFFCVLQIGKGLISDAPDVSVARNDLVRGALDRNPDYLYWLDSDMDVAGDSYEALRMLYESIQKPGVDVVSGMYAAKTGNTLAAYKAGRRDILVGELEGKLTEVDAVGLGCCLMKTAVFDHVKYPWFRRNDRLKESGEDIGFCTKARKAGFRVWVDGRVKFDHVGIFRLSLDGKLKPPIDTPYGA